MGFTGSAYDFRFSGNLGYDHGNSRASKTDLTREMFAANTKHTQFNRSGSESDTYRGNLEFSQDLGQYQFITASFDYKRSDNDSYSTSTRTTDNAGVNTSEQLYKNRRNNKQNQYNARLNYQMDFKKPERNIIASYKFSSVPLKSHINSTTEEFIAGDPTVINRRPGTTDNKEHLFSLNYIDVFAKNIQFEQQLGFLRTNYNKEERTFDDSSGTETEVVDKYSLTEREVERLEGTTWVNWRRSGQLHLTANIRWDYNTNNSFVNFVSGNNPIQRISQKG